MCAVVAAAASADDSDAGSSKEFGRCRAAEEETRRRVVDRAETTREARVVTREPAQAPRLQRAEIPLRVERVAETRETLRPRLALARVLVAGRGEDGQREVAHRRPSANSAPCEYSRPPRTTNSAASSAAIVATDADCVSREADR